MPHARIPAEKRTFAKSLRRALTVQESELWRELRGRRFHGRKFRRQMPIEGFVADFVCLEAKLIVEVDGPLHRLVEQRFKGAAREEVLARHGFRTLRLDGETAIADMLEAIRAELEGNNATPTPHPTPD